MMCKEVYKDSTNFSILGIDCHNLLQLESEIKDRCLSTQDRDKFINLINSIDDTGFKPTSINNLPIKEWQVGECLAEVYLSHCYSCSFPWSSNKDLKNQKSSLPGADLVGFYKNGFAFGEVKTSSEKKYPPQVTSAKDGLNNQLNNLCSDQNLRMTLIQYLFHRLGEEPEFKQALTCYLKDNQFNIFGVLVRDTKPNIDDWKYLKKNLSPHLQSNVFLIALYLPHSIKKLHQIISIEEGL